MKWLHHKKAAVFDLDGTLVDSMVGFAEIASTLIEKYYSLSLEEAKNQYLQTSGLPFFMQLEEIFPKDGRNQKVAKSYEQEKLKAYYDCPFFEGVPEALAELKKKGLKLVVSSNNFQEVVDAYFVRNNTLKFHLLLGFKEGFSKGSDHFNKVLEFFGISKEELFFVGDSLHDARKALDFGIDFVGKVGTFSEADFCKVYPQIVTVANLGELIG